MMELNGKGLRQVRGGHPWLYDDMVDCKKWPAEAGLVPLGEHWFLYSPKSKLRLRRLGPSTRYWPESIPERSPIFSAGDFERNFSEPLIAEFSKFARLQSQLVDGDPCFRWIFAENQGLPGLVLDVFDTIFVAQIQSAAVEAFWPALKKILESAWGEAFPKKKPIRWIEDRSSTLRKLEGLEVETLDQSIEAGVISWNGLKWSFRPGSSQKTGAYLDQRINHRRTVEWAKKLGLKKAWDLCCFEGGFGLHLARAGLDILFLDQSEKALAVAKQNLEINDIDPAKHIFKQDDVFRFLRDEAKEKPQSVPAIVLDPPSFTRSRKERDNALRGYFELHRQSLKALQTGGLLVSCSCSHHITAQDLEESLREASHSTRRDVRIIDSGGPAPDHGSQVGFPESQYLHALYAVVGN